MIKAILFDYGGVISEIGSWGPFDEYCAKTYGRSKDEFKLILKSLWNKARVNEIPSANFWKGLAEFLGADQNELRAKCIEIFGFREEMLVIARKLKKNYKLGIISNQIEDWLEDMVKVHKLNNVFDVISASYKSRVAKPELSIFEETAEKLGVKPEECVYIDDLETNIPPALELGMKAILFEDITQLKNELSNLGVNLN